MIYQLKILLQHTSPPIWRRLLVDSELMLPELHETIQLAFDWQGYHLHCFEARKTNGMRLTDRFISIGVNDEEQVFFSEYEFDEREEKLSNWLVKEKDKLVYVYDFGDDWRHEIVLEKILPVEPGHTYPYCVKAMRGPAAEDSGGFWEGEGEREELNPKELQADINDALTSIARTAESAAQVQEDHHRNGSNRRRLLQLAKEFNEQALWQWLDDDQIFAVQHPESGELAYCSIMGAAGQEFGLAAFIGNEGLQYLKGVLSGKYDNEAAFFENRSMVLSFDNRNALSPEDYDIIKAEGISFRGKNKWPLFRSLVPGYHPWFLSDEEAEWFSIILERAFDVCYKVKEGLEIADRFSQRDTCYAQVPARKQGEVVWTDKIIPVLAEDAARESSKLLISDLDLQRVKSIKKKYNTPLEIGVFYTLNAVQDSPDDKPYFPEVFLAAERKGHTVVFHDLFSKEDREARIQMAFIQLVNHIQASPREVWVTQSTYLILKPVLEKLRISAMQLERLPIVENVKSQMFQFR
ncbi:plasmid pRiA4b ORF-3 family protein [Cytobacillus sp. NCCP-133]|uniref:plasmid pRiA4b ORF-3 family protein n=1 Tax=Cytobacillus sp. NCCP-133 TaxID=766848 RepID=UPI00222E105B|nr:plasmid pRiA4b ORF-3 family protein [Cytobacillus sp. NCCP-133]GLB61528.1 hypothetical protein NCCP133_36570 [Cytobacillus sp. NCCP-133]